MSEEGGDPGEGSARYYATKTEQQILVWGLRQYFALPERSSNRNKLAAQVTQYLQNISPHWSHRAVRLWFNNNKKTFMGDQPVVPPQMMFHPAPLPPPLQQKLPQQQQNPKQAHAPPQQVPPMQVMPAQTTPPIKMSSPSQQQGPQQPQQTLQAQKIVLPPLRTTPKVRIDTTPMNPPRPMVPPQAQPHNNYVVLRDILKEIEKISPTEIEKVNELRIRYDRTVHQIINADGSCSVEKLKYGKQIISFPKQHDLGESDVITPLIETPSDFSLPSKIISFTDTSDSFLRSATPDQVTLVSVWQERACSEEPISYFDTVSIRGSIAAYSYNDSSSGSGSRIIAIRDVRKENGWRDVPINSNRPVEALLADGDSFYCYSGHRLFLVDTATNTHIDHPVEWGPGMGGFPMLARLAPSVVALGCSKARSLFVAREGGVECLATPYSGLTALSGHGGKLLVAANDSFSVRMHDADGREVRSFVGHIHFVRGVAGADESTFLTRSDDGTVRLWDVRAPLYTLAIAASATAVAGSGNFVVAGLNSKAVGVVDIRAEKAALCVPTQDYYPEEIGFDAAADELLMFGIIARENGKDSMVFVDNEGQSHKRVFRRYKTFTSLD